MMRTQYKPKLNVKLRNKLTNDVITVDILSEEEIDGKTFWVVRSNNRTLKLSKDAYVLK